MRLSGLLAVLGLVALSAQGQIQYGYRVVDSKPQSRDNFVQGLEIVGDYLYLSSGNYGQSRLRRYHFASGKLDIEQAVDPRLFAEGLTVFDGKVYQLTWRAGLGLIYRQDDLAPAFMFRLPGEGWGLTHSDRELIYSDGSHQLHFIDPETMQVQRSLSVTENGIPVVRLNELEWIDGRVWANVWQTDRIVIIDPESGEVTASVNLQGLLPPEEYQADTDVLNGIARNPADDSIWVTGKRWPFLYRIELVPLAGEESAGPGTGQSGGEEAAAESR